MGAKRQLVVFKIGDEEFAIDIMLTREVLLMREITPVPETEGYVEGVMNLRGHLVPVLDLRKRLRVERHEANEEERILITDLSGRMAGLIVDGASEVVRISDESIEPVPDLISETGAAYVEGVINLKDRFITLIDLNRVLSDEIVSELDVVMRALSNGRQQIVPAQAS